MPKRTESYPAVKPPTKVHSDLYRTVMRLENQGHVVSIDKIYKPTQRYRVQLIVDGVIQRWYYNDSVFYKPRWKLDRIVYA